MKFCHFLLKSFSLVLILHHLSYENTVACVEWLNTFVPRDFNFEDEVTINIEIKAHTANRFSFLFHQTMTNLYAKNNFHLICLNLQAMHYFLYLIVNSPS